MRIHRLSLAALCALSLVLASCGKSGSNNGSAQLRVLNAFPEAAALDVTINTSKVATGLPFQGMTQYANVDSGTPTFVVGITGATTTLINTTNTIASGNKYTYVVFGPLTGVGAILGNDTFADPGNALFSLRVLNAAPGAGAVDVYLTAPGADISATAPSLSNVGYGVTSAFVSISNSASFEIRVTPTGTKEVVFDSTPKSFADHTGNDLVLFSKGSGKLVNAVLLNHDSSGTGSLVDNLLAQYKIVNASLVPSALNVFVDSVLQLSNIPFTGVSNYQKIAAGPHTFRIEATSTPGAALLTLPQTLAPATDTSIALAGTAGALTALVLTDDNLPPPSGTAGVRIVNVSAGGSGFDVFVNFSKQVSGLAANTASSYLNFNAAANTGTGYEFDFNTAGTTSAVLKLTGIVLTSGHKYTIYIAGSSAAPQGIVTQDF